MATNYLGALDQLLKYDIGRSAYFDVTIPAPSGLAAKIFSNVNTKTLSYLCHSAELPGESIATVSQKIYGVVEKYPIMSAYNDITLSFYTPGLGIEEVRQTFLTWIALFTGRGEVIGNGIDTTYNVKYKDEIVCQPTITHYTSAGEKLLSCTLTDAFPIAISQIPLAWSAENQAISFNVTFAYTEYQYNFYENSKNFTETINNFNIVPQSGTQVINTGINSFNTTLNSYLTPNFGTPTQQSNILNPNFKSLNQG